MSNLIIEIGNTALKAAWCENGTIGKIIRYQGEKRIDFIVSIIEKETFDFLTVASVNEISATDEKRLQGLCKNYLILDSAHNQLLERYGIPSYLTYDRAASLIAARKMFSGKACTVFDFGTTMTIDFISETGEYLGGNISPGCRTRFKAINRYSRNIPLLDTPQTTAEKGTTFKASVESGIIRGIMFEIEGYIASNPGNINIFTGGDAIYFVKQMKNTIFAVCNLVLMGLSIITDEYVQKDLQ